MFEKELRLHDIVTTGRYPIYYGQIALHYYKIGKYTARQLETWKHENIRWYLNFRAIDNHKLLTFQIAVNQSSGYCFETSLRGRVCQRCRFAKTLGESCRKIEEYYEMNQANSFIQFELAHEKWCKKLKNYCWQKYWEEYRTDPKQIEEMAK